MRAPVLLQVIAASAAVAVCAAVAVPGCSLDSAGLLHQAADFDGSFDAPVGSDDAAPTLDASEEPAPLDAAPTPDATPVPDAAPVPDAGPVVDAGPTLVITGGTYDLFGADAGVCSGATGPATKFTLTNQHGSSVEVRWVNPGCTEVPYATVIDQGVAVQPTYDNHVWRVRQASDKAFLGDFRLTGAGPYSVTVK